MTWDEVLWAIKQGCRARRKSWSGDKWIEFMPEHTVQIMRSDWHADMVTFVETVIIHCKDGRYGFYATTQCDMMADDWEVGRIK